VVRHTPHHGIHHHQGVNPNETEAGAEAKPKTTEEKPVGISVYAA
jgi:hypothetical protein